MKVELHFVPNEVTEERLKDRTAVVVDVLRASTTICAALAAGAKEVIPAESIPAAIQLASLLSPENTLLCGEREGKLIDGFDLGNSPFQYIPAKVKGKTLIFGSTNGSPTIVKTRQAGKTYICGFVNIGVITETLAQSADTIEILCSGRLGQFSIEDAVCAGIMLEDLGRKLGDGIELNDCAAAALILGERYRDSLQDLVVNSHHGKYLAEIGMEKDLPFCADLNRLPLLPVYTEGKITVAK